MIDLYDPLDVLEGALHRNGRKVKRTGDKLVAQCPAHDDRAPSLSVGYGSTRPAVLHCHAGCKPDDVLGALALKWTDLGHLTPQASSDTHYVYVNADGLPIYRVTRYGNKKFAQSHIDANGEWVKGLGDVEPTLYHLDEVLRAVDHGETIYVAEGEKDVDRLRAEGVVATCNSGGATKMRQHMADLLAKAAKVILVEDNDEPGRLHVEQVIDMISGRTEVVRVKPATGKDAFDHLAAGRTIGEFVVVGAEGQDDPPWQNEDWKRHDLALIAMEILNGTRQRQEPEVLEVDGAMPLLYRGRTHSIFGAPGGGKTWVAVVAIAERLKAAEEVLFIDWEDNPDGIAQRLVWLGCTPDMIEQLDYRNPATELATGAAELLRNPGNWTLVVIDSAGEALAAGGVNSNDDGEVAQWMLLAKRFAKVPSLPAVLMLDHVPKASGKDDAPAATYAIGSQRKLAAITGAAYRCDTLIEPAIGKAGKLKLVVAKDRLGHRPKGSTACEVHLDPDGEALTITLRISDAQAAAERGEKFRPTVLMERVSRWVEINPGAGRQDILKEVPGKAQALRGAIDALVEEGWLRSETAPKGGAVYHSVRSFREADAFGLSTLDPQSGDSVPSVPPGPARSRDHDDTPTGTRSPRSLASNRQGPGTGDRGHPDEPTGDRGPGTTSPVPAHSDHVAESDDVPHPVIETIDDIFGHAKRGAT